jgi:hypothetical protein
MKRVRIAGLDNHLHPAGIVPFGKQTLEAHTGLVLSGKCLQMVARVHVAGKQKPGALALPDDRDRMMRRCTPAPFGLQEKGVSKDGGAR